MRMGPAQRASIGFLLRRRRSFYGAIGNVPRTAEYFGWIFDSDCRGGGEAGAPGCDYGAQYDEWMADQGYDVGSDSYQVPSALAAFFGAGKMGRPKGSKAGRGSMAGVVTNSTHFATVEVRDKYGVRRVSYSLRSGEQTPEEKALSFPNNSQASHTEARAGRMSGGSPTVHINGDRFANLAPVSPGDTVTINAIRRPCSQCQGSMTRAAQETGATFIYRWDGKQWSTDDE